MVSRWACFSMKSCPTCQRVFPNDAGFCPADGTPLAAASMAPAAPSADDARIGTRLCGRYELRRVVADGGMGRVYEGIDKQTDTRIAVKVLHDDVAKDEVALERFKREYEINASLPHEHIVKVLDFQRDTVSQAWLLVMEFLDGEELRYVLKREKVLPPERLVRMLSQVAIGLDEAHARGFIHRDLKPDNLFLCGTREGDVVKLLDFGTVKDTGKQPRRSSRCSARRSAARTTWRRSKRRGSRPSTRAPTCSRSPRSSTSASPARCRSPAPTARRSCSRS